MKTQGRDLKDLSLVELFRLEVETQAGVLTDGLLALERGEHGRDEIGAMMRAAHSLKGAARLVECTEVVELAHAIEEHLTQRGANAQSWAHDVIDLMLEAVDTIDEIAREKQEHKRLADGTVEQVQRVLRLLRQDAVPTESPHETPEQAELREWERRRGDRRQDGRREDESPRVGERTVRVSVERFDALVAFVGDVLRNSRWLRPFATALRRLNRGQTDLLFDLETLGEKLRQSGAPEEVMTLWADIRQRMGDGRDGLREKLAELEVFDAKLEASSARLNVEIMASRLRPFRDGVRGLPRIVRGIGRTLGKDVKLDITGMDTRIDREVLQRIEAPLSHLLNNAVDHGIETEEERVRLGKPREGRIHINASHHRASINIKVSDDGRGIDRERVIEKLVRQRILDRETASALSDHDLFDYILLPRFSTRDEVSELSGRGVGLDVVVDMLRELGGSLEIKSHAGQGTEFVLRLPLTRTVFNALLFEVGGEPYAVPLNRVERILRANADDLVTDDQGRLVVILNGKGMVALPAARILELSAVGDRRGLVSAFVLRDADREVAVLVDRLVGEKELVVRPLPEYLGKIRDVSAASLLDNDEPVLILDTDEFLQSARAWMSRPADEPTSSAAVESARQQRVLVVDDSITVRELQRQLLTADGYDVGVAVDGLAGWNLLKNEPFDLLITDVDMPRLDGLQLLKMVRADDELKRLPVMVMSYMDRAQDSESAFKAGANAFLPKADFQDTLLRREVRRLLEESVL